MTVANTEIVKATDTDMIRFYGAPMTGAWEAHVMKRGRHVLGVAGVIVQEDGELYGFMDLREWSRTPLVLRHILKYLKGLKERQIDKVRVAADTGYDRAEEFLKRLHFTPTDEVDHNGHRIWTWQG